MLIIYNFRALSRFNQYSIRSRRDFFSISGFCVEVYSAFPKSYFLLLSEKRAEMFSPSIQLVARFSPKKRESGKHET